MNLPMLTEKDMDRSLFDRDQRKPVRAAVDDYVVPAGGAGAGSVLAALQALTNINRAQPVVAIQ